MKNTCVLTEHSSGGLLWGSRLTSCTRVVTEAVVDLPVQIPGSGKGRELASKEGVRQLKCTNVTTCEEKTWAAKSVRDLQCLCWMLASSVVKESSQLVSTKRSSMVKPGEVGTFWSFLKSCWDLLQPRLLRSPAEQPLKTPAALAVWQMSVAAAFLLVPRHF